MANEDQQRDVDLARLLRYRRETLARMLQRLARYVPDGIPWRSLDLHEQAGLLTELLAVQERLAHVRERCPADILLGERYPTTKRERTLEAEARTLFRKCRAIKRRLSLFGLDLEAWGPPRPEQMKNPQEQEGCAVAE